MTAPSPRARIIWCVLGDRYLEQSLLHQWVQVEVGCSDGSLNRAYGLQTNNVNIITVMGSAI